MTRTAWAWQEKLRQVWLQHLANTDCLDRIEYAEIRPGSDSYIGWIRILARR